LLEQCVLIFSLCFFFSSRRRHTRFSRDWSSDVCSSDLLDIDSRDALVAALNDYTGAVLIISHDRHLIDATVDKLWIAQNGTIEEFDEDLDFYQRMLTSAGNPKSGPSSKSRQSSQDHREKGRQEAATRRAAIAPPRKQ